jgi:hypothetical protein
MAFVKINTGGRKQPILQREEVDEPEAEDNAEEEAEEEEGVVKKAAKAVKHFFCPSCGEKVPVGKKHYPKRPEGSKKTDTYAQQSGKTMAERQWAENELKEE